MILKEMKMTDLENREAFEAWYCRNHTGLKQSDLAKFRTLSGYSFSDSLKINISWEAWQAAKAQSVPEGRTDFEIINQTIELVDLLALSTNVFQRDPKSKVHPFESENPRVMAWWRTACQIQELLTNTDPDNCDFEEYKAMIEAQEPAND